MAEAKIALHVLNAGMVLDRSVFVAQTVSEMQLNIAAVRSAPKKAVTVIENGATFFTAANMLDLIKADDPAYKLIAEKAKVTLRDDDVAAIKAAEAAKKAIEASMIPPIPPYTFAAVPEGWSIATDLIIGKVAVRRRRTNSNGNGTIYQLSLNQLKRIWLVASKRWQLKTGQQTLAGINSAGYTRSVTVEDSRIAVGCQTIQRYELEQLALRLNWEFPEVPAKA